MRVFIGVIMLLHGLVHLWYVTLSQGLVAFQPEMGWTGRSWLLTNALGDGTVQFLATVVYAAATVLFLVAGGGLIARQGWARGWTIAAAVVSVLAIVIFWDDSFRLPVEKGLIGLLLDLALLVAVMTLGWPQGLS
jgi:hypothetical protein